MTTTTTFKGMEPGSKSSSRVLRPPGGDSNISFGTDQGKPPVRKDKMASNVFAEDEDLYAHRRSNPPGGKPTGVLCGESSAPLRRAGHHTAKHSADRPAMDGDNDLGNANGAVVPEVIPEVVPEMVPEVVPEVVPEQQEEATSGDQPAAGLRRNPPGGKSSLVLG